MACASHVYFPRAPQLPEAESFSLVEKALDAEVPKLTPASPAAPGTPENIYVRIGDKPASREFLSRVPVHAPFQLRPDPRERPRDGRCVTVDLASGDAPETFQVNLVYGHDHGRSVTLDHRGSFYIFRKTSAGWEIVRTGGWIE